MCTYLDQVGSTYYFRRVVPAELRPFIRTKTGAPRTEWKISLKTKDRDSAKRMLPAHTVATQAEIDAAKARAEQPHSAPEKPAEALSDRAAQIQAAMFERAEEAAQDAGREMADREERYEARAELRQRLERAFRKSTAEITPIEAAARDMIRDLQFELTIEREKQLTAVTERAEGRRGLAPPAPRPVAAEPRSLMVMFERYADEQGIKATTRYNWKLNLNHLVAFLGHDDATRISFEDLDRWKDVLLTEIGATGKARSPETVRGHYFTTLRAVLNWAVEKRLLEENIASKIVVRVPRRVKLRNPDFTDDEAKKILKATFVPMPKQTSPQSMLARRWIPWICAYTGARVNEISQLRGKDVSKIDGIWTIRITPEAGSVKTNIARIVPLHPHLIDQGFLAVAEHKGDAPLFYDPAKVRKPGDGNRQAKKVGERLSEWVRDGVGITDPGLQPNHGWRHTFKSRALASHMPERIADAIQGHAPRSVGQTYGSVPLATMYEAIAAMPKFDIKG